MVTGGGVTAVRFGGVIKSDLGRKSGGTGCVCVFRGLDWEIGKVFGITFSLGSTHAATHSARPQMCHGWGQGQKTRPHGTSDGWVKPGLFNWLIFIRQGRVGRLHIPLELFLH